MSNYYSFQNLLKVVMILLFLYATSYHPYAFYIFLRWFILIISIYFLYLLKDIDDKLSLTVFASLAVIYNPIFPLNMKKDIWVFINVLSSIALIITIVFGKKIGKGGSL